MTQYWAPFLHIYQPPTQDGEILKRINTECYEPLLKTIDLHRNAKITLNINSCLIDLLQEYELTETIKLLQKLVKEGRIEIVGTGKYHPIIPLIPEIEALRQISLNEQDHNKFFNLTEKMKGFFPPEMAVSKGTFKLAKQAGYTWAIMSGIAANGKWPYDYIQIDKASQLVCFFRDDIMSNLISFNEINAVNFVDWLNTMYRDKKVKDCYAITAMDGETFGHHIKNHETAFLGKAFSLIEDKPNIKIVFLSDLIKLFPQKQVETPKASTWSTSAEDLKENIPYPLWKHPDNQVHKLQYRMLNALYELMAKVEAIKEANHQNGEFTEHYQTARWFCDQSLHSCWLWWASMRPMWSANMIYKGAHLTILAGLNAQLSIIKAKLQGKEYFNAEQQYNSLIDSNEELLAILVEMSAKLDKIRTF